MRERAAPDPKGGDWLLQNVQVYDAGMNVVRALPEMKALAGITPDQFTIAKVDPMELDYWTLKERIAELEAAGRPADEARAALLTSCRSRSRSCSCRCSPRSPPSVLPVRARYSCAPRSGWRSALLISSPTISASRWAMPAPTRPLIAAWAPFLLFLLIGEAVLIRTEE